MEKLRDFYVCMKSGCCSICNTIDVKFQEQFGFKILETRCDKILDYLYADKDSSSLAVTRILFGLAMLFDIPDERGGAVMDKRWGDPKICHFPLIPFIKAIPMPYMALVYTTLWLGALGITLGFRYRLCAAMFSLSYWYLFLIEKSYWNNHSYLFGVVSLLFTFTRANSYWSIDAYLDPSISKATVPYWNYFILKYQFFILYFMAGMKKGTAEWLTGYSVQNLSEHWVFGPFKLFLSVSQTDYFIVHWFVFAFDLTVAMWMMWARSRHVAIVLCSLFHLMNSRLFRIGMFPWVCLATMPLFYPFDWPKLLIGYVKTNTFKMREVTSRYLQNSQNVNLANDVINKEEETEQLHDLSETDSLPEVSNVGNNDKIQEGNGSSIEEKKIQEENNRTDAKDDRKRRMTLILILFHVVSQAFLPYSHFITKGYNNWTKGLYGYSWDMMVHSWDIDTVVVKIKNNVNNKEFYIDPYISSPNDRWTRHGDMIYQYARCLNEKLSSQIRKEIHDAGEKISGHTAWDMSIYVDVWCSMNGRFTQRMFDSKVDLLNVSWSPLEPVSFLMPLLDEALHWRSTLYDIRTDVNSWNNYSDVIFAADFPGYDQEKYIPSDLSNVTLTILNGTVLYEPEVTLRGQSYKLTRGDRMHLLSDTFHRVINIGGTPAYYMYTFSNASEISSVVSSKPKLPIDQELTRRMNSMITFLRLVMSNLFDIFFLIRHC